MSNLSDVLSAPINLPNEIPNDWRWRNIVDVCQPKQWKTISQQDLTLTGFPVFGANGFIGYFKEFNHAEETIAVTCRGATCGTVNLVPPKTYITGNAMCFDDVASNTSKKFLYYASIYRTLTDAISGSAQPQITGESLKFVKLPFPPLPEQKKIASILTSVDEVIETTQKQIGKLQDLKKATMNELLTKGVGHTEFKDSELGRIPKSWEVVSFQEVFASYTYGPRFSSKDYSPYGNVKTIRGTDLTKDWNINYKQVPLAALDEKVVAQHRLEENDVVMITTADCGFSSVFHEQDVPFIASAYAIRLRPTLKIDTKFCVWYLQTSKAKDQIEKFERKGTVSNLPGSDVMKVKLPLPPTKEQSEIVKILHSIKQNIAANKDKLAHTQSLKKSLMQDLLTGKVRVQVN